jgi:hypothetical protein
VEQAGRLFAATSILSYKVFFFTCYSMGLRFKDSGKQDRMDSSMQGVKS